MKYLGFFLLVLATFSCSSEEVTKQDNRFSGSRIKVFSSCSEIEAIVQEILYNNRDLNESKSRVTMDPYFFKCEWEQENNYDPNDFFIVRQTNIFYHVDLLMDLTPEEILAQTGSTKVNDSQLNKNVYKNILITKGFDSLLRSNTYILYVWKESGDIDQVVIRDINRADYVPDLLEDSSVVEIFIAMLESFE